MVENFEAQIAQGHTELEALKSQGEVVYKNFIDDAADFLKNWYEKEARSYIKMYPDLTTKLGEHKLRELKNKLTALMGESDKIATQYLLNVKICWHLLSHEEINSRSCDTTGDLSRYRAHDDKKIDNALHMACEKIGEILKPYGYMPQSHGITMKQYRTYRLEWSEPMKKSMDSYSNIYKKAASVSRKIVDLNRSKEESQAEKLWDSV